MNPSDVQTHAWVVSGRVQGVGYRQFIRVAAERRGIRGWVRNRADGRVEIVVVGTPEEASEMEAIAAKGPVFGRVDNVEKTDVPHEVNTIKSFEIR